MFRDITLIDYARPLAKRTRKVCGPYHWRPTAPGKGRGFYSSQRDALTMDRAGSSLALRLEWANDHLSGSRLSHISGYYADPHGDGETLQPIIARLPHGRGFLAGWTMGAGMCGALDSHVWTDVEEAARAAHDLAESDGQRSIEEAEADEAEEAEEGE